MVDSSNLIIMETDNIQIPAIWVEYKYISEAIEMIHFKGLEF